MDNSASSKTEKLIDNIRNLPEPIRQLLLTYDVDVMAIEHALKILHMAPIDPFAILSAVSRINHSATAESVIRKAEMIGPLTMESIILQSLEPFVKMAKDRSDLDREKEILAGVAETFAQRVRRPYNPYRD